MISFYPERATTHSAFLGVTPNLHSTAFLRNSSITVIQPLATPNTSFTRLLGVSFSFYSHCRRYVSLFCNKYFKFHTPWLEFLMFCWVANFTHQVHLTTSLPLIAFFLGRILLKYELTSLYCLFWVFLQIPILLGSFSSLPGLKLHCPLQDNVAHPFYLSSFLYVLCDWLIDCPPLDMKTLILFSFILVLLRISNMQNAASR